MHATHIPPAQPKRAAFIDSIVGLSDPLSSMSSIFSLISLLTLAYQVRTPLPSTQERLVTLMHTMSPASRPLDQQTAPASSKRYSREEVLNSFIHFLSPVLNGMAGMLELLSATNAFSRPEDFRQFWDLEGCNLIREFIESGSPPRRLEGYDVPFLDALVQDPTFRIALGKNNGVLLLVPGDAQVGDDVWWDDEAQRLAVSRHSEDKMTSSAESYLDEGARRANFAVQSAT
ncbi:hypothetical protein AK830_g9001 [Neonectria ditissima]|uniref:Uncharacterized protein n=1 Tax=Neonectria ditissima TaxID=78410 RepID=A0A0P7ASR1_9HYPO|nr:hypothetical protein AK830_g9001 [Neonectria ditissima]